MVLSHDVDGVVLDAVDMADEIQHAWFAAQFARRLQALVREDKTPGLRLADGNLGRRFGVHR
jgi:hypothetical protein